MKWFKKPQDLYDLLMLESLFFGDAGNFATRVPGGWIFYIVGHNVMASTVFVPFSDEFQNLSDENIKNLADHPESVDTEETA